jgi:hypothetical protein
MRTLIGIVVVSQRPLQAPSVTSLMLAFDDTFSEEQVRSDLEALASVIPVPESETDPVKIISPSFSDFIQDPRRCKDPNLCLSLPEAHLNVTIACLRLMNSLLREDICSVQDFTITNAEIADLHERLDDSVPESLRYACNCWIEHVILVLAIPAVIEELQQFCEKCIFPWIEVLSLLGNLNTADFGLPLLSDWCRVRSYLHCIARRN